MLKTNSKKARENIRNYIIANYDGAGYDLPETDDFKTIAKTIYRTFTEEKYYGAENAQRRGMSKIDLFREWAAGLPSILDTCYYYNRSAVDDLAAILEETDTEKSKYNEQRAEYLLTNLIYREIIKEVE